MSADWQLSLIEGQLKDQRGLMTDLAKAVRQWERPPRGRNRTERPSDTVTLVKVAAAELLRRTKQYGGTVEYLETTMQAVQRLYPADSHIADFVIRATVAPAMTGVVGNAAELATPARLVIDFLGEAQGAFAQLASHGLLVDAGPPVKIPGRVFGTANGAWVTEGSAKPVYAATFDSLTLTASKVIALSVYSNELAERSPADVEEILKGTLAYDLNAILDATALGVGVATSSHPKGLFNGAQSITASTASPLADAAMADLGALAAAVSIGGSRPVYVANTRQAVRIRSLLPGADLVETNVLPANQVGAVDSASLAAMLGGVEFASSADALLHMGTAAAPISAVGTPNVVSAPVSSVFQIDAIALKSTLRASWGLRRAAGAALTTAVGW
jgi:HK97 family phage major capsid protein